MATAKTTTLTLRIATELKKALRTAAEREHRSIANMVAVLIMDHCERNGISRPARRDLPRGSDSKRKDKGN